MAITYKLPTLLTTLFVVALDRLPVAADTLLPWRIGRPYRRAARDALGTPALTLTHRRSTWRPAGLDLPPDDRRLLRRSRHHILVSTTAPPYEQPFRTQVARATARAIAEESGGLVIDPLAARGVFTCDGCPGERAEFRLDDDWLGWDITVQDHATCPPWNPADNRACACLRVTSRGLRRFALPEITLDGAACAHTLCAVTLLRAVAARLAADHFAYLATHPTARSRTIDDHLLVDRDPVPFLVRLTPYTPTTKAPYAFTDETPYAFTDTAAQGSTDATPYGPTDTAFFGSTATAPSPPSLRVHPTPGDTAVTCLKVDPPSTFPGTVNDWLCATQRLDLPIPAPATATAVTLTPATLTPATLAAASTTPVTPTPVTLTPAPATAVALTPAPATAVALTPATPAPAPATAATPAPAPATAATPAPAPATAATFTAAPTPSTPSAEIPPTTPASLPAPALTSATAAPFPQNATAVPLPRNVVPLIPATTQPPPASPPLAEPPTSAARPTAPSALPRLHHQPPSPSRFRQPSDGTLHPLHLDDAA
ncbi:hypothetical protein ACIBG7_01655 [Nonomuraea sp. NPDC050328]|uniref:hypothetical protein n=1 Tax=Nonomuraea sp. NPDC050328 TaxID=3364361 RepID=UPI0037A378BA